jgi:hypothetical protein
MKNYEKFFSTKLCVFIIIFFSILAILFARYVYYYDLINQDSDEYIAFAKDLKNYFTLPQQVAVRFFPHVLVFVISYVFSIPTESAFVFLNYFFFFLLAVICFFYFKQNKIDNILSLSLTGIVIFGNYAILYNIFNFFQLVDLLTYIFIISHLIFIFQNKPGILLIISLMSITTKEHLLLLSIASFLIQYQEFKNKNSIFFLFLILLVFIINFILTSNQSSSLEFQDNFLNIIINILKNNELYLASIKKCLITDKNIFLIFPFILIFFQHGFFNFMKKYFIYLIYMAIPILYSVLMYHEMGQNFFRVFNQGFFIFILLSLVFLAKNIKNELTKYILFFSPISFMIDYLYIFANIKQHGFYDYFINVRYNFFSGFYIFNILFLIVLCLNNKFLKKI